MIHNFDGDIVGEFFLETAKEAGVSLFARTQDHHGKAFSDEFRGGMGEEVESLLTGQAGDDADQGTATIPGQAVSLQQIPFAGQLAFRGSSRIVGGQVAIGFGIPLIVVGAVEDSGQLSGSCLQHTFQARPVFRGENLPAVLPADRVDPVGKDQSRFQEVELSRQFELRRVQPAGGEGDLWQRRLGELPLIGQVVDGQKRPGAVEKGVGSINRFQICRDEGGVPVVAMNHVGRGSRALGKLQSSQRKQRKAFGIVRVVPPARLIQSVAIVVRGIVDEETPDLAAGGFIDGTEPQTASQRNREAGHAATPGFDPAIAGQNHRDILTELAEGLGQGA